MPQSLKEGRHYRVREDFSERQRQVLDLLVRGRTNREIAEELGISLDGAKYHVSEVITKLGVDSREEAAEWWRQQHGWPRKLRRALGAFGAGIPLRWAGAGGSAVLMAGLVVVAAVALMGRDDAEDAPAQDVTPTTVATAPAETPATADGDAPDSLPVTLLDERYAPDRFAAGEAIDAESGLFFLDIQSGRVERWDIDARPLPGTRLIATGSLLIERDSGRAWRWDFEELRIMASHPDHIAFETIKRGEDRLFVSTGRVMITDTELRPIQAFSVPAGLVHLGVFSRDGTRLAIVGDHTPSGGDSAVLRVFDLADGRELFTEVLRASDSALIDNTWEGTTSRGEIRVATYLRPSADSDLPRGLPAGIIVDIFDWDGHIVSRSKLSYPAERVDISPDGQWAALQITIAREEPCLEGCVRWPGVAIVEMKTSRQVAFIRGASLRSGAQGSGTRWLSNSEGVVLMAGAEPRETAKNGEPYDYGYVVFRPARGDLEYLPFASNDRLAPPVPSPLEPDAFAVGHTEYVHLGTGQRHTASIGPSVAAEYLNPWMGGGREISFVLPRQGRGDAYSVRISRPVVEAQPSEDPFRFTVSGTGTCLNTRAQPGRDSQVTGCIPEGTSLRLGAGAIDQFPDMPPRGAWRIGDWRGGEFWIYVQSQQGHSGWVSAKYLAWEP